MEVLAALGLGARELFSYNRENYKFDQDQRLERELLRIEMQIKRFELFREDVRDLVDLTVSRMDVYHLVGALFLTFCVILMCEGRTKAETPPFLLALYLLSNVSAFCYLLVSVWLSMHASIASHSFGVRLLVRFVRLPIPSSLQITNLSSKLAEFEFQDLDSLMRVPFKDKKQTWKKKAGQDSEELDSKEKKPPEKKKAPPPDPAPPPQPIIVSEICPLTPTEQPRSATPEPRTVSPEPRALTPEPDDGQLTPTADDRPIFGRYKSNVSVQPESPRLLAPPPLGRDMSALSMRSCPTIRRISSQCSFDGVEPELAYVPVQSYQPNSNQDRAGAGDDGDGENLPLRLGRPRTRTAIGRLEGVRLNGDDSAPPAGPATGSQDDPNWTRKTSGGGAAADGCDSRNLLEGGENPVMAESYEDFFLRPNLSRPGRHIQLFRKLQAKWQCYDAYCRVCMALGVNQILQCLSYFCICHTLLEHRSPSACAALIAILQGGALAVAILEISGVRAWGIAVVQLLGALPPGLTWLHLFLRLRNEKMEGIPPDATFNWAFTMFFFEVMWLQALLQIASPSQDDAELPRRFRTVLFLDVFGDAEDPFEDEFSRQMTPPASALASGLSGLQRSGGSFLASWNSAPIETQDSEIELLEPREKPEKTLAQHFAVAVEALAAARFALKRWEALPSQLLSSSQRQQLAALQRELSVWRRALSGQLSWFAATQGLPHDELDSEGIVSMEGILPARRSDSDPYDKWIVGPFLHDMGDGQTCEVHYIVEEGKYLWEEPGDREVLTLPAVVAAVRGLEAAVRLLLAYDDVDADHLSDTESDAAPLRRSAGSFRARQFTQGVLTSVRDSVPHFSFADLHFSAETFHQMRRRVGRVVRSPFIEGLADPLSPSRGMRREDSLTMGRTMSVGSTGSPMAGAPISMGFHSGRRARLQSTLNLKGGERKRLRPARLPWQVLSGLTRVLQFCWGTVGMFSFLREWGAFVWDRQVTPHGLNCTGGGRRLFSESWRVSGVGNLEEVDVRWPYGNFFRPEFALCAPESLGGLIIGTEFSMYTVNWRETLPRLREIDPGLPRGVPLCASLIEASESSSSAGGVTGHHCLWATLSGDILRLRRFDAPFELSSREEERSLKVEGRRWISFGGAMVRCNYADAVGQADVVGTSDLMLPDPDGPSWCLLLAGWDGASLPIALIAIDSPGSLPRNDARIRPYFDAPLHFGISFTTPQVVSVQVEPASARVWALLRVESTQGGDLTWHMQAWDLRSMQTLGRWRPLLPWQADFFEPVAICEDGHRSILLVGLGSPNAGRPASPRLLRAALVNGGDADLQS